jgi:hypothetical protein
MSRSQDMPFDRGSTWYNGRTIDTDNLEGGQILGRTGMFESVVLSDRGVKGKRLQESQVVVRAVRNSSGFTIYGKRLVKLSTTDPNTIVGIATTVAEECYPVDEYLPSTGCPNGDICYIVVAGPAMCLTPMDGGVFGADSIAAGDVLVALTTTGGTTQSGTTSKGGRVATFVSLAPTTAALGNLIRDAAYNYIGRALSAMTSGQTNSDILVSVGRGKQPNW